MRILSILVLVAGIAGAALTQFGIIGIMPMRNWIIVTVVGAVFAYFMRQPGD